MATPTGCAKCSIAKADFSTQCPEIVEAPSSQDVAPTLEGHQQMDMDTSNNTTDSSTQCPEIVEAPSFKDVIPTLEGHQQTDIDVSRMLISSSCNM